MSDWQNENDQMSELYESGVQGIYIPPVEEAHRSSASVSTDTDPMSYFSNAPQATPQATHQVINEQGEGRQQVLNEKNHLLSEALVKLQSAHIYFEGKDREYLKEIREAIEELIE